MSPLPPGGPARPEGAPLGPGCLLRRYAGDWRSMLPGSATGLMQLMLPALGQGVAEHSLFFSEPFARIYRSIPQIWATIFEEDGERRGHVIRDFHRDIKGTAPSGRRYHALDPETFWWAHATFTWNIFRSVELFHLHDLTDDERAQLYAETVTWYRLYGVSERPVPADVDAFEEKFTTICAETLEITPAADRALHISDDPPASIPGMPGPVRTALRTVVDPLGRLILLGSLPDVVRERFALPWSRRDAAQLEVARRVIGLGFGLVPTPIHARSFRDVQRYIGARTRAGRLRGVPA